MLRDYTPHTLPRCFIYNKHPALNPPGGCGGINLLGGIRGRPFIIYLFTIFLRYYYAMKSIF